MSKYIKYTHTLKFKIIIQFSFAKDGRIYIIEVFLIITIFFKIIKYSFIYNIEKNIFNYTK